MARMLPGVSAEDNLFADLGFDPVMDDCVTYEAADFLLQGKPMNPFTHNILWQGGCIGVRDMIFDVNF